MKEVKKVLTIAGSDSSGGAGIQADLKTMSAHNVFGMSVITAVTAQNTKGVLGVYDVEPEFVGKQIDAVFDDIVPDAVKIGMVSNVEIIKVIAKYLERYKPKYIVLDPVMVSTSGCMLINDDAMDILVNRLIHMATVITPNIPEAEVLSGFKIEDVNDMVTAAEKIFAKTNNTILIKGGHLTTCADDLLYDKDGIKWFRAKRIDNNNTHGTGCTLSSAIACNLAMGEDVYNSIKNAKNYVYNAINAGLNLGSGDGPLWHNVEAFSK